MKDRNVIQLVHSYTKVKSIRLYDNVDDMFAFRFTLIETE